MMVSPAFARVRHVGFLLAISAYMLSFFHRMAPAAIAVDLAHTFQINATSLGVLAATYFYIYTVLQIPTGVLADRWGSRKLLTCGGIVAGLGSILFGMAPSFAMALVGRTLVGLGVSVIFIAMLKLIAISYVPHRFATLTGVAMCAGNLGAALAGVPLAWAVQTLGWRSVFVVVGMLSLLIGSISAFFVRDDVVTTRVPGGTHAWRSELLSVLKNRATWPGFFVNFGIAGSFFSFAGLWAVPYLTQGLGFSRSVASNHLSLYFIAFALGALCIGRGSDALGRRKPLMMGGAAIYTAIWLVWIFGGELTFYTTYPLFMLAGFVTPSFTLTWSCAKEVNPPALSGMATGIVNTGMFLGGALLQPFSGWVMDRYWKGTMHDGIRFYSHDDYRLCLGLHFAMALLGLLASVWVRETYCRNQSVEK